MVVGAAIRIEEFGSRRSLWVDEALVVNNVVSRDFRGLLRPLSGEQGAPIGWLWAQRADVIVFGNNEYALRVVPLLAGILALVLVHRLARRALDPLAAAVATWLAALSPAAVRYSVEVKQYSSDLAICLLLGLLAVRVGESPRGFHRRDVGAWGIVGAIAVWCAHPAVLVLVATGGALGVEALRRREVDAVRRLVAAGAAWGASFVLVWFTALRRLGHDAFLRAYWSAGLAPRPLRVGSYIPWLSRALLHLITDPVGMSLAPLAALLVVAGLAVATIRRPLVMALVLVPMGAAVAAATVAGFPLRGRLALWLLPIALIGLASAVTALLPVHVPGSAFATGAALAAVVGVGFVVSRPTYRVLSLTRDPVIWSDLRPLLEAVHRQARPGDLFWVHEPDAASAQYYAIATGISPTHVLRSSVPPAPCPGDPDLAAVAARHRVWVVYGYRLSTAARTERADIVTGLNGLARQLERVSRPQATAWLYDFAQPPTAPPPAGSPALTSPPSTRSLPCLGLTPALPPVPTGLSRGPLGTGGRT